MNEPTGWRWLPLTAILIVIDQITKLAIVKHFELYDSVRILPVLNIVRAHNRGAAFSMLDDASGWQRWFFTVLALGVGIAIVLWMGRLKARSQGLLACALSLILAGALGNLIDRVLLGHVIDFIQVHWGDAYFPSFNVADSAISVGAALLLLDALLESRLDKGQRVQDGKPRSNEAAP